VITTVKTRFTDLAGCRVPIQQAPMGSMSTPALAVAVADAGGVGCITALGPGSCAWLGRPTLPADISVFR
jgi:NAD(P)H-dependent flavin oxidoreductase YrpB (nitropropane dioxygenase family)